MERIDWPACLKCSKGTLIPLSDYGREGAPITYKAWVCTNPSCSYNLKIRNGEVFVNESITDASLAPPQVSHEQRFRSIR